MIECVCVFVYVPSLTMVCVCFQSGSRSEPGERTLGTVSCFSSVLLVGEVMYGGMAELQGAEEETEQCCCCCVTVWPPALSGRKSSTQRMLGRRVCRDAGSERNKHRRFSWKTVRGSLAKEGDRRAVDLPLFTVKAEAEDPALSWTVMHFKVKLPGAIGAHLNKWPSAICSHTF